MDASVSTSFPGLAPVAERGGYANHFRMDTLAHLGNSAGASPSGCLQQNLVPIGNSFPHCRLGIEQEFVAHRMVIGQLGQPWIILGHGVAMERQFVVDGEKIIIRRGLHLRRARTPEGQWLKASRVQTEPRLGGDAVELLPCIQEELKVKMGSGQPGQGSRELLHRRSRKGDKTLLLELVEPDFGAERGGP